LNYSGGGLVEDTALTTAINNYTGLFICAAGNDGANTDVTPHYPSSSTCTNIISVGASDSTDSIPSFSNRGPISVDLFAPGQSIYSTYPVASGYSYASLSGTSMATPMVTGVAALMKSANPNLTTVQIKNGILNNVDTVSTSSGKCVTGGRLNAYKAIKAASSTPDPVLIPATPPGNGWTLHEESDSNIFYSGNWNTGPASLASGGTVKMTSSNGAFATFTFKGDGIEWDGLRATTYGTAIVTLDGVSQGTINMTASATYYKQSLFHKEGLDPTKTHTITITVTSSPPLLLCIDCFMVHG